MIQNSITINIDNINVIPSLTARSFKQPPSMVDEKSNGRTTPQYGR